MTENETKNIESESLSLLVALRRLLAHALNSLGSQSKCPPAVTYLIWSARMVCDAVTGYLFIRTETEITASKLLVRPILEATFNGTASVKDKGFLFRKAYHEWEEDNKLFKTEKTERDRILADLEHMFSVELPDHPIKRAGMSVPDAAAMAGLSQIYSDYRAYCQFTHGAFRAITGALNEATDLADNEVVIQAVWKMLEMLRDHTSADVQTMPEIRQRLVSFLKGSPKTK